MSGVYVSPSCGSHGVIRGSPRGPDVYPGSDIRLESKKVLSSQGSQNKNGIFPHASVFIKLLF